MTTEAACTKLGFLFGQGLSNDAVNKQMARSLRGELTEMVDGVAHDSVRRSLFPDRMGTAQETFIVEHE